MRGLTDAEARVLSLGPGEETDYEASVVNALVKLGRISKWRYDEPSNTYFIEASPAGREALKIHRAIQAGIFSGA